MLKNLWLRKSIFNPPQGLPELYASRKHLAGVEVPYVEILHYSERWLLLQTQRREVNFFEKMNTDHI